jgi:hypothetical protein
LVSLCVQQWYDHRGNQVRRATPAYRRVTP